MKPLQALIMIVLALALYSYGIYQAALYYNPIKMQIEVNDWKIRNTKCHWQLLEAHQENKKLRKLLKLKK